MLDLKVLDEYCDGCKYLARPLTEFFQPCHGLYTANNKTARCEHYEMKVVKYTIGKDK